MRQACGRHAGARTVATAPQYEWGARLKKADSVVESGEVQQSYLRNFVSDITGWSNPEAKLAHAFAQDHFILYSQTILKLAPGGDNRSHIEIFVRLQEEEQNLTPPGTFLPILEHYNFGPRLDRHVLHKTLVWYCTHRGKSESVIHINLCGGTLADKDFPAFVHNELSTNGLSGGECICFEIPDVDTLNDPGTLDFVKELKAADCRIAVGSMERENIPFKAIKYLEPDYVKIGGPLIRELVRDKMAAAKVRAAIKACREFKIQTVAQYVEDAPTLALLQRIEADYAQGYGISKPGPLRGS